MSVLKEMNVRLPKLLWTFLFVAVQFSLTAQSKTTLVVRAKAKDGKFIGSSIGGALIVVRDADTGELLAKGFTQGSTGNTGLIMNTPVSRGMSIVDDETAKFKTELVLGKPQLIQIEVITPYSKRQATVTTSTQMWMLPGKHVDGDGIIIEVPGIIVDVLNPTTHKYIDIEDIKNKKTEIRINAVMMCGCIITPGGLWDGNKMEVEASIYRDDKFQTVVKLKSIEMNIFQGFYEFNTTGNYEVLVTAFDPVSKNAGVDRVNFVVND